MIDHSTRAPRCSGPLLAALFAVFFVFETRADETYTVDIGGKRIHVTEESAKCDIGSTATVSAKRLVDCDSAEYIEFRYKDHTQEVIKFTIEPDQEKISDGVRAELRDMYVAAPGEEVWYRFSTLIPNDDGLFPIDPDQRLVTAQWHQRHNSEKNLRPPLSHRLWGERFAVTLWHQDRVDARGIEGDGKIIFEIPKIQRGIWYDFIYKIKWSSGEDGVIDSWMRQQCATFDQKCGLDTQWKQTVRYRGPTGYDEAVVNGYYFKFGLYTVSAFSSPLTIFHRHYDRGENAAEIGETSTLFRQAMCGIEQNAASADQLPIEPLASANDRTC